MTGRTDATAEREASSSSARIMLAAAVGLALAATAVLVLSDSVRWMRLGVLAALWAALAGAFLAAKYRRQITDRAEDAHALRQVYELELEREVAARREFELEAEAEARAKVESEARDDLAELREELRIMRENLEKLLGGGEVLVERIALRAEATRMRSMDSEQRVVGAGQGAQLRRLTAAKSVPGDAETEMIERIRADAKAQPRKRRPDFTPHPAEVSDRWFIDGPDSEPIDPNWTPSWETGEQPRIQNGRAGGQARPRAVEPRRPNGSGDHPETSKGLRPAQRLDGSAEQSGAEGRRLGGSTESSVAGPRPVQRLGGSAEHAEAQRAGQRPSEHPAAVQRLSGSAEHPAAETSKGLRPAQRVDHPAGDGMRPSAGQNGAAESGPHPGQRLPMNGSNPAVETSKGLRPAGDLSQAMRQPGRQNGSDRSAPETSQGLRPAAPSDPPTSQGLRPAGSSGSARNGAAEHSATSQGMPPVRRIPAADHPAAETSKGMRPVHPAAETSAGMRRAQRVAAGLESPAETSLGLGPDGRPHPERRVETSLGMGRGSDRQVETSLGMRRDLPERSAETSLGMRHAAPDHDRNSGQDTRHSADSAGGGRSGTWSQDGRRPADSGAEQRAAARPRPPAPQRLSDKTAVEPVDARVVNPAVRSDSEGGRRRAPTGTFPPVILGGRAAEATPAETSGYQPRSAARRSTEADPAETGGYQSSGRRSADETGGHLPSSRRSADGGSSESGSRSTAAGSADTGGYQPGGRRSAEALSAESSGYQPSGRRSAEAKSTESSGYQATGRRAKPDDDEGGRRRRAEGTPPWQDTSEPAGSHAEGTSVKDLLAAHGGTASTGRRRRRED